MKEKKIQVYLSWLQDNYSRGKSPPPPTVTLTLTLTQTLTLSGGNFPWEQLSAHHLS